MRLVSDDDVGALGDRIRCLVVDIFMNLVTQTLELNVNSVIFAVFATWYSSLVAEFAHENKLLEQAEVGMPSTAARACIVHQVCEQIVVIELFDFLEDAQCVFSEPKGLVEQSALGSRRLLLR